MLTKVTPAIVAVWFIARREWRHLAWFAGAILVVGGASFALAPGLWSQWVGLLVSNGTAPGWLPVPSLVIRAPLAAALIWWGARTDRPWVVPVAVTATFAALWPASFAVLLATVSPRLKSVAARGALGGEDSMFWRPPRKRAVAS